MTRTVVLVDAVRTPFGKAGGMYAGTRADDLLVRAIRGLLERNPKIDPAAIEDVAMLLARITKAKKIKNRLWLNAMLIFNIS